MELQTSTREELAEIGEMLEECTPEQTLSWAVKTYGRRLTMATAFGAEGCVLISMLAQVDKNRDVRIFNLDTGYQFAETLEVREQIRERYGIEVELVRPAETVEAMEQRFGGPIHGTQPDLCCHLRKVVPLRKALEGYDAWISAIRRDQTAVRSCAGIVEWDAKRELVKINPLARWTERDVWAYIRINEVPYNALHDQGYRSIGCQPCTRAVQPDEDPRAGRWSNFAKLECGIHQRR